MGKSISVNVVAPSGAGRMGKASEIREAAVFLAWPFARYIHRAVVNIDGGWLAS